ncbi:conserved hypothetical protein [Neisseria gonorrhoeae]|uniref:Uncharacterized protein n=1 Tax=Neisseria gonorrhoeae TaxID=485 RepID=A0AB74EMG0_NEIGO|nr:conserved hypothetical protein [Neisseria gonorrhoeae]SCW12672.1 conserved hypothetical protein [Neisseria gonorrhoeae]SCW16964.1 conserved hypothetical protein [Neisseria gonorrhoeae]SCW16996.1 conserved hypothetical protein [Neisseria gonorrhoeae]SCW20347.1 conserved hypothetical protein [Neisseria gonorrhoeae]
MSGNFSTEYSIRQYVLLKNTFGFFTEDRPVQAAEIVCNYLKAEAEVTMKCPNGDVAGGRNHQCCRLPYF